MKIHGVNSLKEPEKSIRVRVKDGNPNRDRLVPAADVRRLHLAGTLAFDADRSFYKVAIDGHLPNELREFPLAKGRLVGETVVVVKKSRKTR